MKAAPTGSSTSTISSAPRLPDRDARAREPPADAETGSGPRPGKSQRLELLRRVRLVMLDVDGVLTDGRLWLGPDGEEWKSFHVHDGLAIARAIAAGLIVAVVSSRQSAAVAHRCKELGVTEVHQGVSDKLTVYEALCRRHGCRDEAVAAIGRRSRRPARPGPRRPGRGASRRRTPGPPGRAVGDEATRRRWCGAGGPGGNPKSAELLALLTQSPASNHLPALNVYSRHDSC